MKAVCVASFLPQFFFFFFSQRIVVEKSGMSGHVDALTQLLHRGGSRHQAKVCRSCLSVTSICQACSLREFLHFVTNITSAVPPPSFAHAIFAPIGKRTIF